jgi:hypothetical protein
LQTVDMMVPCLSTFGDEDVVIRRLFLSSLPTP